MDSNTLQFSNQYYCDNIIYNNIEEAKANPNCIEFTLYDQIS